MRENASYEDLEAELRRLVKDINEMLNNRVIA